MWQDANGSLITCRNKVQVLEENMQELQQQCQDALDDALLMGCGETYFKNMLLKMVNNLSPTVKERK